MAPLTESTCRKRVRPSWKNWACSAVKPDSGCPEPTEFARTPGSRAVVEDAFWGCGNCLANWNCCPCCACTISAAPNNSANRLPATARAFEPFIIVLLRTQGWTCWAVDLRESVLRGTAVRQNAAGYSRPDF